MSHTIERTANLCRTVLLGLVVVLIVAPAARAQHGEHGADEHAEHREMLHGDARVEKVGHLSIPDVEVVTEHGETVRFYRDLVEDRTVAMNFVFTTCTTICPPLGANFGKLQELLGERAGEGFELISVSVDPVTDTPDRLKAWGRTFGADEGWTLVTGSKDEVTRLLKALQVFAPDFEDHSPVVIIGNAATDTWTRAYGLAPPAELVKLMEQAAASGAAADHGGAP